MNRHTLSDKIRESTGLSVTEFAQTIGATRGKLDHWHRSNPLLLKLILSGYRKEVLKID